MPGCVALAALVGQLARSGASYAGRMTILNILFATLTMPTRVHGLYVPCWSAIRTRSLKALCLQLTRLGLRKPISSRAAFILKGLLPYSKLYNKRWTLSLLDVIFYVLLSVVPSRSL